MRKKILLLLLGVATLLAFSACDFIAEKTDEISEQINRMQEQYDELQQLYTDMKDMMLGHPDAEKTETKTALIGIESKLLTFESILKDEPEAYYDLDGLKEIEQEMQSAKETMTMVIESGSLQALIESGGVPGFDPGTAGEYGTDNLAAQKTMRILELTNEIAAVMKPEMSSWHDAYQELNLRYQQFSLELTLNNPDAYENGAPGNAELLEQLDGFILEYEQMLASIN